VINTTGVLICHPRNFLPYRQSIEVDPPLAADAVGRKAVLYSGFLIKEQLDDRIDGFLAAHRLWLAQYGPRPVTPRNWPSAWLWQFTGDGVGPKPHSIPGIVDTGIDINHFDGDAVKLAAEWSGPTTVEPATA
jgi:GH25 family lysozyme M1 (1,4-beta-N-acetylmuramidase)